VDDHEGSRPTLDTSARIFGTYIHGLFDNDGFRRYFLNQVREKAGLGPLSVKTGKDGLDVYDALADVFEENMDMPLLNEILGGR
jgi:adenosylcobyric acid synthase